MKTKSKEKEWITWMRDNGRWSIAHIIKETKNGLDITVCGMDYDTSLVKAIADTFFCADCADGKYNPTDLRSSLPFDL